MNFWRNIINNSEILIYKINSYQNGLFVKDLKIINLEKEIQKIYKMCVACMLIFNKDIENKKFDKTINYIIEKLKSNNIDNLIKEYKKFDVVVNKEYVINIENEINGGCK